MPQFFGGGGTHQIFLVTTLQHATQGYKNLLRILEFNSQHDTEVSIRFR